MACHKVGGDGEQIVGEIAEGVWVAARTVNHEFCASFLKDVLQKVGAKARQSVSVQDHNLADHAVESAFQKGTQALSLKVDAGADVADDIVLGVGRLERFDLPVEVAGGALLGRANAGIDDAVPGRTGSG